MTRTQNSRPMEIVEFKFESPLYRNCCLHRDRILRQPLGLSLWQEDLSQERSQLHFGMIDEDTLVAGLILRPGPDRNVQLRQMWVLEQKQGQGLGRALITGIETQCASRGFWAIYLAARVSAIGFYKKLGFRITSPAFEAVGLPHQKMEKILRTEP